MSKNISPAFFKKPIYLLSILLNSCLAITSLVLVSNKLSLVVNTAAVVVFILMTLEAVVRTNIFLKNKELVKRYKVHVGISFISMITMLLMWEVDFNVLLIPFLFYRAYKNIIKVLDSKVLSGMGTVSLTIGVIGVPLQGLYGQGIPIPAYFAWMAALSAVMLSIMWEHYSEGYLDFAKKQEALGKLENLKEFNAKMHSSLKALALKNIQESMVTLDCGVSKEKCQWHRHSGPRMDSLASIYFHNPDEPIDLQIVIQNVKDVFPDITIHLAGWRSHIHGMNPYVLTSVIKFMVSLTKKIAAENKISNPTVWITSLPEYISVSDESGGTLIETLDTEDISFISTLESEEFSVFYGMDILINVHMQRGIGRMGAHTIIKPR